jgi:hypothetical protein
MHDQYWSFPTCSARNMNNTTLGKSCITPILAVNLDGLKMLKSCPCGARNVENNTEPVHFTHMILLHALKLYLCFFFSKRDLNLPKNVFTFYPSDGKSSSHLQWDSGQNGGSWLQLFIHHVSIPVFPSYNPVLEQFRGVLSTGGGITALVS